LTCTTHTKDKRTRRQQATANV